MYRTENRHDHWPIHSTFLVFSFPFLFLPLLFPLLSLLPMEAHAEQEKLRIAAILPLSGQVASLGNYAKQGMELALQNLPAHERAKIELIYEDDQFQPTKTIAAYRRLQALNPVRVVCVIGSPPANALAPITERDKTLLLAIASDPKIVHGREYSFLHWVIPSVLGEKLAEEILRRNFKRLAILAAESSGAIADADALEAALKLKNWQGEIVLRQDFPMEISDFRTVITTLRPKSPDLVVAVLFPGALSSFAKQFRNSGIKAELAGMESMEDEAEIKAAGGALEHAWYVNASDATDEFAKNFSKVFGHAPGWGSANAYDSIVLLAQAAQQSGVQSEAIRDYLRTLTNFSGASGTYSASGDHRFTLPAALKRVRNGRFETFSELTHHNK